MEAMDDEDELSFYAAIVILVDKATKHAVVRRADVIEQCVVYSLRYLLERSVRIPSLGKGGMGPELDETLVQGDSLLLQATSSNLYLYLYL